MLVVDFCLFFKQKTEYEVRIICWSSDVCSSDLKRRVVVQVNLEGRDAGSFVAEAQQKIAKVKLPAGYYLEWGGQFESLQAASKRLSIVVPLCFAGIFLLLYMALGTFGRATAVFLAVPLGLAGGVFTLARSEEHTSELQSLMRISY